MSGLEWRPGYSWPARQKLDLHISISASRDQYNHWKKSYGWYRSECDSVARSVVHRYIDSHPNVREFEFSWSDSQWPVYSWKSGAESLNDSNYVDNKQSWPLKNDRLRELLNSELADFYLQRGFLVLEQEEDKGTELLSPAYSSVMGSQKELLIMIAHSLLDNLRPKHRNQRKWRLAIALSFVQSIPYSVVDEWVDSLYVGHWLPPFQTLRMEMADCDSKAMLLIGIWYAWYGDTGAIPILYPLEIGDTQHVLVGIPTHGPDYLNVRRIEYIGGEKDGNEGKQRVSRQNYVICETTKSKPPGILPKSIDRVWQREYKRLRPKIYYPW